MVSGFVYRRGGGSAQRRVPLELRTNSISGVHDILKRREVKRYPETLSYLNASDSEINGTFDYLLTHLKRGLQRSLVHHYGI